MNPVTLFGVVVVNLALVSYGIGVVTEQRSRRVAARALFWLKLGVVLDIVATSAMVVGSTSGPFTLHGAVGFSALAMMLTETGFAWRHRSRQGDAEVPGWLHQFSRFAYGWWIVAYFTGAWLVMSGRG